MIAERLVIEDGTGRMTLPFDREHFSVSNGRIILRFPGTIEIYRLKYIRTFKNGKEEGVEYVAGECLRCLKLGDYQNQEVLI